MPDPKHHFDYIDEAAVVIDTQHANVHRGLMYVASMQGVVASAGVMEILIQTGARDLHVSFTGTVSQDMLAAIYETPTFSAAGTTITARNRNREPEHGDVSVTTFTHTPTLTGDGTILNDTYIPGGQKNSAGGGGAASFVEWELPPNGVWLLRVSNTLVSPASAGHAGITIEFYEPDTA